MGADLSRTVQVEPQSRAAKFLRKNPAAMLRSMGWNMQNWGRDLRNRLRFGLVAWQPRGVNPAYLAHYPDGLKSFPDLRPLYARWIRGNKTNNNGDAARFMALLLNVRQLEADGIAGDFAELGVWKGNSAAVLAQFAGKSGRRLFLFDTFSGFDARDLVAVDAGRSTLFTDTSIDYVRETIGDARVATFVPGFFPESLTDEARSSSFALAHIDCDLYEPMKAALEFFYPRMPRGGMLILHDYSSGSWAGASRAVDEFCRASGEFLSLWPDKSGTAMVRKSKQISSLEFAVKV